MVESKTRPMPTNVGIIVRGRVGHLDTASRVTSCHKNDFTLPQHAKKRDKAQKTSINSEEPNNATTQ
jgi:hypothetical protein